MPLPSVERGDTAARSTLGNQILSTKNSNPSFGFGSASRYAWKNQYLSREQMTSGSVQCSPGSVYDIPGSVGQQYEGDMPNIPQMKFGTAPRIPKIRDQNLPGPGKYGRGPDAYGRQIESTKKTDARVGFARAERDEVAKLYLDQETSNSTRGLPVWSPGPLAYTLPSSIGKQADSSKKSSATSKFSTQDRFGVANYPELRRAAQLPAADAYTLQSSYGTQLLSGKKTYPTMGIPKGTRAAREKQSISWEHDKINYGRTGPGPAYYDPPSSIGKWNLKGPGKLGRSSTGCGFSKAARFQEDRRDVPGPGAYRG